MSGPAEPGNSRADPLSLAFIGGTGPEGRGLALRFALAGREVIIGSRDAGRAADTAAELSDISGHARVSGALNSDAAAQCEVAFVVVPFAAQAATLAPLADLLSGKVVVDVVAPLEFVDGQAQAVDVEEGSAALQAQAILTGSKVVAAFQTISARDLLRPDHPVESDVVVCGDDDEAKRTVMLLAGEIDGLRAVDGGSLRNARYVEDFTALLLNINRIYKAHSAIRIAGI